MSHICLKICFTNFQISKMSGGGPLGPPPPPHSLLEDIPYPPDASKGAFSRSVMYEGCTAPRHGPDGSPVVSITRTKLNPTK